MDATEIVRLEKRLAAAKEARAKAQGVVEQLTEQLRTEFGINTEEELNARIAALSEKVKLLSDKSAALYSEIDKELTLGGF